MTGANQDTGPLERYFDETVARDKRIEPRDWMPAGYRKSMKIGRASCRERV